VSRRVVVTGAGLLSPLGDDPAAVHAALVAGRSGLGPITLFPTAGLPCVQGGEIRGFAAASYLGAERNVRPLDRLSRLVAAAAGRALADAGWTPDLVAGRGVGLVLGTMFCGIHTIAEFDRRGITRGPSYISPLDFANTVINAAAGQTAIWHGLTGVNSTIAGGASSGLQALAVATDLIRSGRADAVLAGGADELCFETFYGFLRAGRLCGSMVESEGEYPIPFDARRNGFALAEGAALLMLEAAGPAAARGARVLSEVRGHGAAFDASRGEDDARAARAVARAVAAALADAGAVDGAAIGFVSAAANGSPAGDRQEGAGLAAALGPRAPEVPVAAIKALLGESLGAAGAFQAIDALETWRAGSLPGIPGLEAEPGLGLALGRESRSIEGPGESGAGLALLSARGFDGGATAVLLGPPAGGGG
jgi:3-oxoacyl-[acyl-carrier-protein] synthase II